MLDTFRYVNFIKEAENVNSIDGKNGGGIPRFNGEATRLGEYAWRIRAWPVRLSCAWWSNYPALRVAQQVPQSVLASKEGVKKLLESLASKLKPRRVQEARELYAAWVERSPWLEFSLSS